MWNREQNEAILTNTGLTADIRWIDDAGMEKNINYRVPTTKQCMTCHNSGNQTAPIGFKIRNLNIAVTKNDRTVNQLEYFARIGMTGPVDLSAHSALPAWNDTSAAIEQKVRAYLEVNCAHCHNPDGFCAKSDFRPAYGNSLSETKIIDPGMPAQIVTAKGRLGMIFLVGASSRSIPPPWH